MMKKCFLFGFLFSLYPAASFATLISTSVVRPNVVSVEALGRAGAYSINYDRSFGESFAFGAGVSTYNLNGNGNSVRAYIFPFYGNYYFSPDNHRGFLTVGVDYVATAQNQGAPSSVGAFSSSKVVFTGGGGYEYRGDDGFLFRVAPYVLAGSTTIKPWFGVTIGYCF